MILAFDLITATALVTALAPGALAILVGRRRGAGREARDVAFDNMVDAVLILDNQGRIIDHNPAARIITGAPTSPSMGKALGDFMPEQRALFDQPCDPSGLRADIEVTIGLESRMFEMHILPVRDPRGQPAGRVVTLRDVSKLKKSESELAEARAEAERAAQARARMVSVISHDFRTPIAAIQGYTDLLKEELEGVSPKGVTMAGKIRSASATLLDMVSNLLDQARLESGSLVLNNAPFAPAQLLDMVEARLRGKVESAGLAFTRREEPDAPASVTGDVNRLAQVVNNLVEYAIKLTSRGSIGLRVYRSDEAHWGVEVADTGVGLPAEDQQQILDAFNGVGVSASGHQAIGLGVSVAMQLARYMGGQIVLRSQEGHGTTFSLILPIAPA